MNDTVHDSELFALTKYNVFRKDRDFNYTNTTRGGGILLATKKYINASVIDIFSACKYILRSEVN